MRSVTLVIIFALVLAGCRRPATPPVTPTPEVSSTQEASSTPSPEVTQAPFNGPLTLRNYYVYKKYGEAERAAVARVVEDLLSFYPERARRQAEAEIMAFHYVVFHTTQWHHLNRNHALIRKFEPKLRELCEIHEVPLYPVLAIVSWENSGDVNKVSWADAAGLGQMTWGAVGEAHEFAAAKSRVLIDKARRKKYLAGATNDPKAMRQARELASKAERMDIRKRHRLMAKEAGVADERQLVEANLEDVVVFFEFLLSKYGGRVDHAIGAYHKGLLNQDDILYDYLTRKEPNLPYPEAGQREPFIEAIKRHNVTYLDLWNDPRSREMLNGLRTVHGEPTTGGNAHMALGDEADIYPWKVLGSLSAYLAGPEHLDRMIARYSGDQLLVEVEGLPAYSERTSAEAALAKNLLVSMKAPVNFLDAGQTDRWITPELDGYLWQLNDRLRRLTGKASLSLPLVAHHGELKDLRPAFDRGVAAAIDATQLSERDSRLLSALLKRDYLSDRIYWRQTATLHVLVVNPRFGNEFLEARSKRSK